MRKHYLLFLVCSLMFYQAFANNGFVYTSTGPKNSGSNMLVSSHSLPSSISNRIDEIEIPVSGTVTDENGATVPGVYVIIKGTTLGTSTDSDGKYSLSVQDENAVLIFSTIGYLTQEVLIGSRTTIDIAMQIDVKTLEEVVVTALGIKKESKRLGYATATVTNAQLTENRTSTAFGTLQGKVSGVNITQFGTGPAGSTRIRIRGNSAFSGANLPLLIVNGVPMDNTRFAEGGTDLGDGLNSINPDDIETMTVLKGAAASALYGSRAKDGVIMITTKSGNKTKGFGVTYNANYTAETALDFSDFQYEYGQGEGGVRPKAPFPNSGVWSFGEKIQPGMTQILFDNREVPYVAVTQKERFKQFYRTANNVTNTISFSNSGDQGGFNLSLANTQNTGILANSDFTRRNITLGFTQNISKWITASGNINYSNEYYKNPPISTGDQTGEVNVIATMANTMPLSLMEEFAENPITGYEVPWSRFAPRTNPYFLQLNRFANNKRDRLLGNIALKFNVAKNIFIQTRIAQDFYTRSSDFNRPTGMVQGSVPPAGFVNGSYQRITNNFRERNYDILISSQHKFGDIGLNITAGGNQMFRSVVTENQDAVDFIQPGLYTIMNGRQINAGHSLSERAVNSIYGAAEVSYKNYLFLNATLRNDWFSTLAPDNRSIIYPSVTGSFVFSDALESLPAWISFGKLRLSYAEVGDDNVAPYSNLQYYSINSNLYAGTGGSVPVGGFQSGTIANPNLRPLRVGEFEAGIDLRLFDNKITFDFAVYSKKSTDQIVSTTSSPASGFTSQLINVGESLSQGFESSIQVSPIETEAFTWNINANAAYNTSEVLKLGLEAADTRIQVGNVFQEVGRPLGQLYHFMQARDADGNPIFNKGNGQPVRSSNLVNIGSVLPTWFGGITNTFTVKGVILSFLIDFKLGKDYVNIFGANRDSWRHGKHKGTLPGRAEGAVVGKGVNSDGSVNATPSLVQPYYESFTGQNIMDPFVHNAGFWKLRQISIGYDFSKFFSKTQYIQGVKLNIVANNVAILKKWVPNLDPENIFTYDDTSINGNVAAYPVTRSIGFNLNVKF
ncbi:MAG: SusC/RagA family TonB-linked outer membrane protein [Saprospiraceae bacterium]